MTKKQSKTMDIKELYRIYTEHPVITTDSRDCPAGSMFFALRGDTFDGNRFAAAALEKGCAYAVVDDPAVATGPRCILVDNTLEAFQALAREHRRHFSIPVIGITGTNGKTTTKELVAAVLAEKYRVHCTQGNYNNDIGVPKTLFGLRPGHEIAVVEMGASHPGDIRRLVETAEPTCGLITNVGMAHLQGFGSFEGVVRTKGELYDYLRQSGADCAFVNGADDTLMGIAAGLNLVKYGPEGTPAAAVEGRVAACDPLLSFEWRAAGGSWHRVQTHLIGTYNLMNMLAAACVGLHFGVSEEAVSRALGGYVPANNRSQLEVTARNRLVVDAYNANPTSMAAALRNFRDMTVGPKMAILGSMGELGDASAEEHRRIVSLLGECGFDCVWLVGDEFGSTDCAYRKFATVDEVKAEIERNRPEGRYILIKGSHSQRLYELPPLL